MYFMGFGLPKDLVYAHMWTNISAMNGSADGTKYRNSLTERMTVSAAHIGTGDVKRTVA